MSFSTGFINVLNFEKSMKSTERYLHYEVEFCNIAQPFVDFCINILQNRSNIFLKFSFHF